MDTRKRVGIGIAALAVAVLAIGLGTYAAFNDVETGPGGTTAAGTLGLQAGSTNTAQLFGQSNIAPGFSQLIGVTLHNAGSLPGTLASQLTSSSADVSCTEPEQEAEGGSSCAADGNLQDQMTVQVVSAPGVGAPQAAVPFTTFVANGLPAGGTVPAGGDATYQLLFALPPAADNKVQGDSVTAAGLTAFSEVITLTAANRSFVASRDRPGSSGSFLVIGSDGDDTVVGSAGGDCVTGGGGADTVDSAGGDDVLVGGDGDDRLTCAEAADRVFGEAGADTLTGGPGRDALDGGTCPDAEDTVAACTVPAGTAAAPPAPAVPVPTAAAPVPAQEGAADPVAPAPAPAPEPTGAPATRTTSATPPG